MKYLVKYFGQSQYLPPRRAGNFCLTHFPRYHQKQREIFHVVKLRGSVYRYYVPVPTVQAFLESARSQRGALFQRNPRKLGAKASINNAIFAHQ